SSSSLLPALAIGRPLVARLLFAVWATGSCVILILIAVRIRRFTRLLRHALPASPALEQETARLAARLQLRNTPPVLMLPGFYSPMLWGFPQAKILFPTKLLDHLD